MKFDIQRASDGLFADPIETVDINSIEDIKFIAKKYEGVNPNNTNGWTGKHTLIIDFESHIITVYDDYIE